MPRPVFDINEYELRGLLPDVYTEEQKALLNKTLARVNGQIDWTAQMLGYNGPKYWGRPNKKADGTYNWIGLPETMNEKRQLQAGTFGVYSKDQDYSQWPAPFNRTEVLASGDAKIHVWEEEGATKLGPLGQPQTTDYGYKPAFFAGGTYIFDQQVEFSVGGPDPDQAIWSQDFYQEDRVWTRLKVKQANLVIGVKLHESEAREAYVEVIEWADSSDWNYTQVTDNFLGAWGNKGASISFDAQFDALDIHGFDERHGLVLNDVETPLGLENLLARVGLKPTEWTRSWNTEFGFKIGNCNIAYPLPPVEFGDLYDNSRYDRLILPDDEYLIDGTFDKPAPVANVVEEGIYEREPVDPTPNIPDNFEFFNCEDDCSYELSLVQTLDDERVEGIKTINFKYEPKADCALLEFPCVEWVFDPTLDNGDWDDVPIDGVRLGPWATADDGIHDEIPGCFSNVQQGQTACEGGQWCGFDDGEFDEQQEPFCDEQAPIVQGCLETDGGQYTFAGPPDYAACACSEECCEINNGIYVFDLLPYLSPELADGGDYTFYGDCVIYDNNEYGTGAEIEISCLLDNGPIEYTSPPNLVADSRLYDRVLTECVECESSSVIPSPCPVEKVYVSLADVFDDVTWSMRPSVRNSDTPLRLWKSRPLTALDQVPAQDNTQYNFLVADENQGPDELGAYRHFARLPLEYSREGQFWNRTQAVCDNQSYFSAPPQLSQTKAIDEPLRPRVYSEEYNEVNGAEYALFYEEDFLVSTNSTDFLELEEGFTDASVSFESNADIPFAFAVISDYDALAQRIPYLDGEWRGSYFTFGVRKSLLTGFLLSDLEEQRLELVPEFEEPVFDMSQLKLPTAEFPDEVDKAAMKNYVVSYAYFVCDFSAADDPVFDPQKAHCWRRETIACSTPEGDECVVTTAPSNTAYLLHSHY